MSDTNPGTAHPPQLQGQEVRVGITTIGGAPVVQSGPMLDGQKDGVTVQYTMMAVPINVAQALTPLVTNAGASGATAETPAALSDILSPSKWGIVFDRDPQTFVRWAESGQIRAKKINDKAYRVDMRDIGPEAMKRYLKQTARPPRAQ